MYILEYTTKLHLPKLIIVLSRGVQLTKKLRYTTIMGTKLPTKGTLSLVSSGSDTHKFWSSLMRRISLFTLLLVLWSVPVLAQIEIGAGGGFFTPFEDAADEHVSDYVIGGNASYYLFPKLSVGAELYYHELGLTDEQNALMTELGWEATKSLTNLSFTTKYLLSSGTISLYVKGVIGSYEYKENIVEEDGFPNTTAEKLLGYGAGLGINFQSEGFFGGFVEAIYNHMELGEDWTDDSWKYLDVRAGISLKGY